MDHLECANETGKIRPAFDRRVTLEFHCSKIRLDRGLLLLRTLDDVLGLHEQATRVFAIAQRLYVVPAPA